MSLGASLAAIAVAIAVLASSISADAHTVGISRGTYRLRGSELVATLHFARTELALAVPELENDAAGDSSRMAIQGFLFETLRVFSDQGRCQGQKVEVESLEADGIAVVARYACAPDARHLRVESSFIADVASGHRHLAHLSAFGSEVDGDLSRADTSIEVEAKLAAATAPRVAHAKTFFLMGVEHILTGYDHLLFLLGVMLVLYPIRSLVWAITAFTFAHSLTLTLATLGFAGPAPRIIEAAVALSIAYVGLENWFVRNARGRWRITFVFGLIHGLAFAGALREIALPRAELPIALLTFNLGVEVGQLGVVALVLPVLICAKRLGLMERLQIRTSSVVVTAMGLVWFVARVAA